MPFTPVSPRHSEVAATLRVLHTALRKPGTLTTQTLQQVRDYLREQQIEVLAMPSPCPGQARSGSHGASPAQQNVIKAFRYGRHVPRPDKPVDHVARELLERKMDKFDLINAGGANRAGKTVAIWGMCFCQHLRDHARNGELYWAIAPDFTKLRQGPHKWLWNYLPRSMFGGRRYIEKLGFGTNQILELTLPNDRGHATIVFKTEEQQLESFESDSVSGIAWTEATREAIYDAVLSRIVDTDGFILVDYLRDEAWHNERFESNPGSFYQHFCMMDNAHNLPPGAIEKARQRMTKDEAAVRIDGKNRAAYGVVIKEFRNEAYRYDDPESGHLVRPFRIPKDWPKWVFTDVGKYTASLLLTVSPDGRYYVADEAYTIGEIYHKHIEEIDSMLARNGLTRDDVLGGADGGPAMAMDPAAWNYTPQNEVSLGEMYEQAGMAHQHWIRTTTIGERAMLDYLRREFSFFGILVFDRCRRLIEELGTWKHKLDKDGKVDPNERYTGPNHAIDCLKAWVNSKPRYGPPSNLQEIYEDPPVDEQPDASNDAASHPSDPTIRPEAGPPTL